MAGQVLAVLLAGASPLPVPETLYAVQCIDSAQGHTRRAALRPRHLAYLDSIHDKIAMAGGMLLPGIDGAGGSVIVYHAANIDEAKALLADDPLNKGGVYDSCSWSSFAAVFGTWVGGWRIDPGFPGEAKP